MKRRKRKCFWSESQILKKVKDKIKKEPPRQMMDDNFESANDRLLETTSDGTVNQVNVKSEADQLNSAEQDPNDNDSVAAVQLKIKTEVFPDCDIKTEAEYDDDEDEDMNTVQSARGEIISSELETNFMDNFLPFSSTKVYCKLCKTPLQRKDAYAHWSNNCIKPPPPPEQEQEPTVLVIKKEINSPQASAWQCPYCFFVGRGTSKTTLVELHKMRMHPEQYFPKERDEALGFMKPVQFQHLVVNILFPEFIRNSGRFIVCGVCENKYIQGARVRETHARIRGHLLSEHVNELRKRLLDLLEDERIKKGRQK